MKTSTFPRAARFGLLFCLALFAVLACGARPGDALDTCGPTQRPDALGGCRTCNDITTPASITSDNVSSVLAAAGVESASFTISNDVGTFSTAGTSLKPTQPVPISLPPVHGSITIAVSVSYEAFAHIPDLKLSWGPWTGGDSGVTVHALLSGHIAVHINAFPVILNPTLTLTNLPVTIAFGTDRSGNAMVSPSQVDVAPVGPHGSVDGCGAFDWCDGLLRGEIESKVQGELQSQIASQFTDALNGQNAQNGPKPFWLGFMQNVVENKLLLSLLRDPAGFRLPNVNEATPGGTRSALPSATLTPLYFAT